MPGKSREGVIILSCDDTMGESVFLSTAQIPPPERAKGAPPPLRCGEDFKTEMRTAQPIDSSLLFHIRYENVVQRFRLYVFFLTHAEDRRHVYLW